MFIFVSCLLPILSPFLFFFFNLSLFVHYLLAYTFLLTLCAPVCLCVCIYISYVSLFLFFSRSLSLSLSPYLFFVFFSVLLFLTHFFFLFFFWGAGRGRFLCFDFYPLASFYLLYIHYSICACLGGVFFFDFLSCRPPFSSLPHHFASSFVANPRFASTCSLSFSFSDFCFTLLSSWSCLGSHFLRPTLSLIFPTHISYCLVVFPVSLISLLAQILARFLLSSCYIHRIIHSI